MDQIPSVAHWFAVLPARLNIYMKIWDLYEQLRVVGDDEDPDIAARKAVRHYMDVERVKLNRMLSHRPMEVMKQADRIVQLLQDMREKATDPRLRTQLLAARLAYKALSQQANVQMHA